MHISVGVHIGHIGSLSNEEENVYLRDLRTICYFFFSSLSKIVD